MTRPFRTSLAASVVAIAVSALGCTTPLDRGAKLYQQGDRLGAVEVWRGIGSDSHEYAVAQQRIGAAEAEYQKLVTRHEQRGLYFERKGRLAEAILSWRVVLKLDPANPGTLAHVQALARQLATRKTELDASFRSALAEGRLADARASVAELRLLDPFDPAAESGERAVDEALGQEVERLLAAGRRGFSAGDYGHASEQFRAVLALVPENESARGYLSYIDLIRESEKARRAAVPPASGKVASRSDPPQLRATDAEIRAEGFHQNALAAERAGDAFGAIRHELRALAASPEHSGAQRHLAALREKLSPDVPELIDAGRTAFQQEDLQSALDHWRRALLVDPGNERAVEYTARAEKLLQNLEALRAEPEPPRAVGAQR